MATVYDKSSLFLAPSGVSNGTVFVQKPVPIYGSEQVTNGDFSQEGAELITNGDFATDSNWTHGSVWSISGGSANCDGTQAAGAQIYQGGTYIINKTYKVTYTVEVTSGTIDVRLQGDGTTVVSNVRTTSGTYTDYLVSTGNTSFRLRGNSDFIGSVNNVSVKEVGQDWTLGTGWSIKEDKALFDGGGVASNIFQSNVFESGKTYILTFDTLETNGGNMAYRFGLAGFVFIDAIAANTKHSVIFTVTSPGSITLRGADNFLGSITNISVKELLSPDGDFTFTRGSNLSATRVNEAQLIEKGRENVLLQSNQFDTTWTTPDSTVTGGQADRDGGTDAWLLTATNAFHRVVQPISLSGVKRFSIYAKANVNDYLLLGCFEGAHYYATFNLATGAVDSNNINAISPSIEDVGNGWYRCSATWVGTTTDVRIASQTTGGQNGWASTTSGSIYIQDAQLEQGLAATSVITTGAGTVQAGILENTPRLDYSGGATCPSLLLEPSRTNRLANSENGYGWATNNVTVLPFDGGINGKYFQLTSNASTSRFNVIENPWVNLAAATYTASVFAKKGTTDEIILTSRANYATLDKYASFNLTSGTIITTSTVTANIEEYSDGWYRCSITFTNPGSYSDFASFAYGFNYNASSTDTLFVTAPQSEIGSYKTSYIPTYGTSQTRAVDDTGTLDLSLIGLDGQDVTHFMEFKNNQSIIRDSGGTSFRFSSDTGNFGSLRIYRSASTAKQLTVVFQDNNGDFIPNGYEMTSLNPKVAIKRVWSTGEIKVFVDGNKVIDAASTLYNSWNKVDMEGAGSTIEVKQLVSFPTVLSDLDCEILTGATTYETFDEMALALNYTVYE